MNVLHLIDTLGMGGAQRVLKIFFESEGAAVDNHRIYALRREERETPIDHPNVSISQGKSRFSIAPLKELASFIDRYQIEVLHCHLLRSQVFGWLLKLIYFPDIKLVFHEHGQIMGDETGNPFIQPLYKIFLKYLAKNVNGYAAVSEAIRARLVDVGCQTEKIFLIYNPVPLTDASSPLLRRSEAESGDGSSQTVIGFAGRLVAMKGWRELLHALSSLSQRGQYRLLIAGDGPEREELLALINELDLMNSVSYLGYLEDMRADFFERIDILVVPSYWEALGMIALESLASGVPVVASRIDGLDEVVLHGETGLLFEVGSEQDMAEKIVQLSEDHTLRDTVVRNGRKHVERFDLTSYRNNLDRMYEQLL